VTWGLGARCVLPTGQHCGQHLCHFTVWTRWSHSYLQGTLSLAMTWPNHSQRAGIQGHPRTMGSCIHSRGIYEKVAF
jgi:hypothetical protein